MTSAPTDAQAARPIERIYYGTCGWTDRTLVESGAFYPADVHSAADRLRYYAEQFPLVEVDSTYYAPPSERNAQLWTKRTPADFVFNVKAYGALTHHPVDTRRLPKEVLAVLPAATSENKRLYLPAIPPEAQEILWAMHVEALRPLAEQDKLGAVLFCIHGRTRGGCPPL